jgi:ethanolamine transporter EutH
MSLVYTPAESTNNAKTGFLLVVVLHWIPSLSCHVMKYIDKREQVKNAPKLVSSSSIIGRHMRNMQEEEISQHKHQNWFPPPLSFIVT